MSELERLMDVWSFLNAAVNFISKCNDEVLHFIIICRVFWAAPASSPASPVAGSYAGFRRLLAYKVLLTALGELLGCGVAFRSLFWLSTLRALSEMDH